MGGRVERKLRRSSEDWERIFERFRSSGMTGAGFCRREKLPKSTFDHWKKRLGRRSMPAATAPSFVELASSADVETLPNASMLAASGEVEVSFPGGVVIRWRP